MRKNTIIVLSAVFLLSFVLLAENTVYGDENSGELKAQIEALQKRVEELEATQLKGPQKSTQEQQAFSQQKGPGGSWDSWDPFEEMSRVQEEMGRMFQSSLSSPGYFGSGKTGMFNNMFYDEDLSVKEIDNRYEISIDMSGFDKDKVDLEVNEHSIAISGQRTSKNEQSNKNGYYSSQSFGSFLKTVPLPTDADTQKMETKKDGNILVIKMPKKA